MVEKFLRMTQIFEELKFFKTFFQAVFCTIFELLPFINLFEQLNND